eukprot:351815-Chlamydomonas_euryale.AAC.4
MECLRGGGGARPGPVRAMGPSAPRAPHGACAATAAAGVRAAVRRRAAASREAERRRLGRAPVVGNRSASREDRGPRSDKRLALVRVLGGSNAAWKKGPTAGVRTVRSPTLFARHNSRVTRMGALACPRASPAAALAPVSASLPPPPAPRCARARDARRTSAPETTAP